MLRKITKNYEDFLWAVCWNTKNANKVARQTEAIYVCAKQWIDEEKKIPKTAKIEWKWKKLFLFGRKQKKKPKYQQYNTHIYRAIKMFPDGWFEPERYREKYLSLSINLLDII